MRDQIQVYAADGPQVAEANIPSGLLPNGTAAYKPMTFNRHQEITALAYRVKKFIDSEGGLKETEGCHFGRVMQDILYLK